MCERSSRDRCLVDLGGLQLNQCRDAIEDVAEFVERELGRAPVLPVADRDDRTGVPVNSPLVAEEPREGLDRLGDTRGARLKVIDPLGLESSPGDPDIHGIYSDLPRWVPPATECPLRSAK